MELVFDMTMPTDGVAVAHRTRFLDGINFEVVSMGLLNSNRDRSKVRVLEDPMEALCDVESLLQLGATLKSSQFELRRVPAGGKCGSVFLPPEHALWGSSPT